jgi:hypothetical protein
MTPGECRFMVYIRDKGCVARLIDSKAGPCYDCWGNAIKPEKVGWDQGEMDYCRFKAYEPRHRNPADHLWLCPGHHRGSGPSAGFQWATSHRREEREWLEALL